MAERHFRQLLTERQKKIGSYLCVGLDPLVEKIPERIKKSSFSTRKAIFDWMKEIVDATAPYASMFKPQHAHWESFEGGAKALQLIVSYIHYRYPDIPIFLDCKRGDIHRTQEQYRIAHFDLEGVDGMNYNPYMGKDTLKALIDQNHLGRALVGLGRTSNAAAWEIQDQHLLNAGRFSPLWKFMVNRVLHWSNELGVLEDAGIVMGAAYRINNNVLRDFKQSRHLSYVKSTYGETLWLLIPGIGTQGGEVEATVQAVKPLPGNCAINSGSKIIFAGSNGNFAEAAARAAEMQRDEINQYL